MDCDGNIQNLISSFILNPNTSVLESHTTIINAISQKSNVANAFVQCLKRIEDSFTLQPDAEDWKHLLRNLDAFYQFTMKHPTKAKFFFLKWVVAQVVRIRHSCYSRAIHEHEEWWKRDTWRAYLRDLLTTGQMGLPTPLQLSSIHNETWTIELSAKVVFQEFPLLKKIFSLTSKNGC